MGTTRCPPLQVQLCYLPLSMFVYRAAWTAWPRNEIRSRCGFCVTAQYFLTRTLTCTTMNVQLLPHMRAIGTLPVDGCCLTFRIKQLCSRRHLICRPCM